MSKNSNALIQMLLSAEAEAESIVKKARENRVKKLREALESAEEEITVLRAKEEELFQSQAQERRGDEDTSFCDLDEICNKEIEILAKDFQAHRADAVSFLVDKIVSVRLGLDTVQRCGLNTGSVREK